MPRVRSAGPGPGATSHGAASHDAAQLPAEPAQFYLALGATGDVVRAAELAGVPLATAWSWAEQLPRPAWLTRRSEAAARMFDVACQALEQVRARLTTNAGDSPTAQLGLRELALTAERFFAAAQRLDREVGASGQSEAAIDLDGWAQASDAVERPAAASGPARGAGL